MKIFGFEVKLDLPGRNNIWALILLFFSITCLIQGVANTHWMASYREGDSIIPQEKDLTRIGPFLMSEIRTRNSVLVGFVSPDGLAGYEENSYDFDILPNSVMDLVRKYSGRPVAYLLFYKNNPIRQIWGVDVDSVKIMSYKKSISDYKQQDSTAYSWFWISVGTAICFLISIFDVQRVKNPE